MSHNSSRIFHVDDEYHRCTTEDEINIIPKTCLEKLQTCHYVYADHPKVKLIFRSRISINNEIRRQQKIGKFVFHPFSKFRIYWDYFMAFINVNLYILLPFFFTPIAEDTGFLSYASGMNFICLIDVIFWFLTGYVMNDSNVIVLNHNSIAKHYLRTYFFPDLISIIPIVAVLTTFGYDFFYANSLKFLRLARITFCVEKLNMFFIRELGLWAFQAKIIFIGLLIILLSTVGRALCNLAFKLRDAHEYGILNYLADVSGSLTLSFTIYGGTLFETFYRIIMNFIGLGMKMVILGMLMHIYILHSNSVNRINDFFINAEQYALYRALPQDLKEKILKYFDYGLRMNIIKRNQIHKDLNMMPIINRDLLLHEWRYLVEKVELFQDLPSQLINRLTNMLISEVYLPNDIIYDFGTVHNSLYFVCSGTLAVYDENNEELCHIHDGDNFGIIGILERNQPQLETVVTVTTCELLRLHRKDYIKLASESSELSQRSVTIINEFKQNIREQKTTFKFD